MKLLTKAIEKQLAKYPIYSQDGKGGKAQVICKFFNPCGSQTWYILEGEKQHSLRIVRQYGRARIWLCVTE